MIHYLFRYWVLVLMMVPFLGTSASEDDAAGLWRDANQLQRERQAAILSETNHVCPLNGTRPTRLQPVTSGKPSKYSGRSLQPPFVSQFHACWARFPGYRKPKSLPCVSLRYDFIALRHIIR